MRTVSGGYELSMRWLWATLRRGYELRWDKVMRWLWAHPAPRSRWGTTAWTQQRGLSASDIVLLAGKTLQDAPTTPLDLTECNEKYLTRCFEFDLHQMISLKSNDNASDVSFSSKTTLKMSNLHTQNTPTTQASTALPEEFYEWVKNIAVNYHRRSIYLPLISSNQQEEKYIAALT